MNTGSTYDPFGWRLEELAAPALNPLRRAELLDELLIVEAEELALGRRHLTVVHGEPSDIAEAEVLNDFYGAVSEITAHAEGSRLAGGADYVTITVWGGVANDLLIQLQRSVCSGGVWRAVEAPYCIE